MADSFTMNVKPDFQLNVLAEKLGSTYSQKGFTVGITALNSNNYSIQLDKDNEGITKILGLGKSIKVNLSVTNGILNVNFTDVDWTSKILTIAIGWLLCFFPLITGIIGVVGQLDLPKNIENDCRFIVDSM